MKKAFTLIELLVVIAILAILAVGLLAAIDPLEQIKKGNDTALMSTAEEFLNGTTRFYASRLYMPWCATGTQSQCLTYNDGLVAAPSMRALSNLSATTTSMVTIGEIKASFSNIGGTRLGSIYLNGTNGPNWSATVCFTPASRSFITSQNAVYNPNHTGGVYAGPGTCQSANPPGAVICDWCFQ